MKGLKFMRLVSFGYRRAQEIFNQAGPVDYATMRRLLTEKNALWSNGLTRAIERHGYEVMDIYSDLEALQKRWAVENDVEFDEKDWSTPIVLAQIAKWKPDVLYFQDSMALPFEVRRHLKSMFPFIKVILMFKGFPHGMHQLAGVDVVLTGTPLIREEAYQNGINAHTMYHGFDPIILENLAKRAKENKEQQPQHDFIFMGSAGIKYFGHRGRYWYLRRLLEKTSLECFLDESLHSDPAKVRMSPLEFSREFINQSAEAMLQTLPRRYVYLLRHSAPKWIQKRAAAAVDEPFLRNWVKKNFMGLEVLNQKPTEHLWELFPERVHPSKFGIEMYEILQNSKITFNKHTDFSPDMVGNMRLFEATGVGTCLLTDTGKNLHELFEPETEVVTYSSMAECVDKLNFLMNNEKERQKIAKAGQQRTLRYHTTDCRAEEVNQYIREKLNSRPAKSKISAKAVSAPQEKQMLV